MDASRLPEIMSEDISYNAELKQEFLKEGRRMLGALATLMGLEPSEYTVRANEGGIAVSGEVTLHSDEIYVQISQRTPTTNILFRTCSGRTDYVGHENNYANIEQLSPGNIEQFSASLTAMVKKHRLSKGSPV